MRGTPLRVLQVGTVEAGGGAASIAGRLMRGYRARGAEAWLAVGRRASDDPDVFLIPDDCRPAYRVTGYLEVQRRLQRLASRSPGAGWGSLSRSLRLATHPRALIDRISGDEDFEFPATFGLLELPPAPPDIVHCHNLHGGYFDLRALQWLSHQVPTVLTLHDAWLLSGHCAHSFECTRWTTGCGTCPDLDVYPAIRRDRTAANWERKRGIYAGSRLYVTMASEWLMRKVEASMLAPAVALARVIPDGVDLSTFHPADKASIRAGLDLPHDVPVVLVGIGASGGPWGDHDMLRAAISSISSRTPAAGVLFVSVGSQEALSSSNVVRHVARQTDPKDLARYFQAADLYLHCVRADTFPGTVLEALACGTPVIASAVGGIPEQIRSADVEAIRADALAALERKTGVLVAPGDGRAMAESAVALLGHDRSRGLLGESAAQDVRERFDVNDQVERYLAWYRTIIEHWNRDARSDTSGPRACAADQRPMALD